MGEGGGACPFPRMKALLLWLTWRGGAKLSENSGAQLPGSKGEIPALLGARSAPMEAQGVGPCLAPAYPVL